MFVVNASRSPEEIKRRLAKTFNGLEAIERDQSEVIKDLRKTFEEQVDSVVHQLLQHLLSDDIKKCFTQWPKEGSPAENASWKEWEENVNAVLSRRFLAIVDQWEEENKVFSTTRTSLLEHFQNHFNRIEFRLQQNIQSEAKDYNSNKRKLTFGIQRSLGQKIFWSVKTFGLSVWHSKHFVRRYEIANAIRCAKRIASLFAMDLYKDLLEDGSKHILTKSMKTELETFVEDKLKDAKLYLEGIDARLQELIKADRELYEQLVERPARYRPLFDEVTQHWNRMAKFGLSEVCAVKIDSKELEWKEETSSCLGRGAFGAVYLGTMERDGEVKNVALKVWNEKLDAANAKEIMEEMKTLR